MNPVLYVSPFAFKVSGADESLLTILRQLSHERFSAHVAVPWGSPYSERFRAAGAQVHELPLLRLKRTLNPFYWLLLLLWMPVEVALLMTLGKKHRIRIIHSNMESTLSPLVTARLLRIPVIQHYRGNTSHEPAWFFDRFLPLICRLSDRIFVISHAVAEGFEHRQLTQKTEVLYNALDLGIFLAPGPKDYFVSKKKALTGKSIVTYAGRLHPRKRIADLIEAAAHLQNVRQDFRICIVGGDPNIAEEAKYKAELERKITSLRLNDIVHFMGREENMPYVLHSSDYFVLPSLDEGFGRALVEAMAAGVPVLTSYSGSFPELLEEGRLGVLVEPSNPSLLAQALGKLLDDSGAKERAKRAQQVAQGKFDIQVHVARLEREYEHLLNSHD